MDNNIIIREINLHEIGQRKSDGYIDGKSLSTVANNDLQKFLNLTTTQEYISELSLHTKIPKSKLVAKEWVHPQIAIFLAYWLTPKFAIIVFGWIKQWILNEYPENIKLSEFDEALKKVLKHNPK